MKDQLDSFNSFRKTIQDIKKLLDDPSFNDPNEQSVKQGIILPILQSLSWPILNPKVVYPEYPVEGGRVDYALCENGRPIILIEAKRFNGINGAEWQVFQYSFHIGTPMVILTDGLEWRFFLPGEEGAYYERILCNLKIKTDDVEVLIINLSKYLSYENVLSRKAIDLARHDYRTNKAEFSTSSEAIPSKNIKAVVKSKNGKSISIARCRFIFQGQEISAKNHQEAAAILLNMVADMDSSLLDQMEQMRGHGQSRKYLAKSQTDIYPDNPARSIQNTFQFRPGWWIPGNLGTKTFKRIVNLVCNTGKFELGKDTLLDFCTGVRLTLRFKLGEMTVDEERPKMLPTIA
jgi:hypothetical protein